MPVIYRRFYDITQPIPEIPGPGPAGGPPDWMFVLGPLIAYLQPLGGGTIFFPGPRVYQFGTATLFTPPTFFPPTRPNPYVRTLTGQFLAPAVPPNITIRIDPGAVFWIAPGWNLVINGTLEAGPYQIFTPSQSTSVPAAADTGLLPASIEIQVGSVLLLSRQLETVYPEWWGARSSAAGARG